VVNEHAQNLDQDDRQAIKKALTMLQKCIEVIDQFSSKDNLFAELYYETYNNIARCMNFMGDIKLSLSYLMSAMDFVQVLVKE
jgi:hypothetical protein